MSLTLAGYYLCYFTPLSYLGTAISRSAANVCSPFLLLFYMQRCCLLSPLWTGFQPKAALRGAMPFLSLGIPGMMQMCFDWWAFEIVTLLCGVLPKDPIVAIGANAICRSLLSLTYRVYSGISLAGNFRIGNALGAGLLQRARLVPKLMLGLSFLSSIFCAMILLAFRTQLSSAYTSDPVMSNLVCKMIYLLAPFQVGIAINCAVQGIFKGTGQQDVVAKLNFVSYYAIGLPTGVLLSYHTSLGAISLWIGLTLGVYLVAIGGFFLVSRIDWENLALEAQGRNINEIPTSNELPKNGLLL
jgi:MATE family multidrug resistance protein